MSAVNCRVDSDRALYNGIAGPSFGAKDRCSMGPQSPATQMLQHVQHLQITDLDSDVDLGEPPSEQALGVPRSWLDDDYDSDSASTSYRDDTQSSCIQHSSLQPNVLDLASQVRQQQQVCWVLELACVEPDLLQDKAIEHAGRVATRTWHSQLQTSSDRLC